VACPHYPLALGFEAETYLEIPLRFSCYYGCFKKRYEKIEISNAILLKPSSTEIEVERDAFCPVFSSSYWQQSQTAEESDVMRQ
jgi:hypothetical protein